MLGPILDHLKDTFLNFLHAAPQYLSRPWTFVQGVIGGALTIELIRLMTALSQWGSTREQRIKIQTDLGDKQVAVDRARGEIRALEIQLGIKKAEESIAASKARVVRNLGLATVSLAVAMSAGAAALLIYPYPAPILRSVSCTPNEAYSRGFKDATEHKQRKKQNSNAKP